MTDSAQPSTARSSAAVQQTIGYFAGHVVLGFVSASLGPTIPALAAKVGEQPDALGVLFTVRALGYLLGSVLGGRLYDRRAAHPLLVASVLMLAASMAVVPFMPSREWLIAAMLVIGGAQGLLDVGNNTMLMWVHDRGVGPLMSALHCFYGVGAFVAPMILGEATSLEWGYWWLALGMLPTALYLTLTPSPRSSTRSSSSAAHGDAPTKAVRQPLVVVLFALLLLFCQGVESSFSGWVFLYATTTGFSDPAATRLVSGFWATFTIGRALAIVIATRLQAKTALALDLVGGLLSLAILLLVPGPVGLWVATLGLGLSIASIFPMTLALAGQRLDLTGRVTSMLFVGASVGSMLMPWLIGRTFALGPEVPMVAVLLDLVVAAAVFTLISRRHDATRR